MYSEIPGGSSLKSTGIYLRKQSSARPDRPGKRYRLIGGTDYCHMSGRFFTLPKYGSWNLGILIRCPGIIGILSWGWEMFGKYHGRSFLKRRVSWNKQQADWDTPEKRCRYYTTTVRNQGDLVGNHKNVIVAATVSTCDIETQPKTIKPN